jgi:acyl carrier protein
MTREETARRVRALLIEELRCPASRIRDDADLGGDLGAGSLDKITVACRIENDFGIRLSDDECAFAQTVGTLTDLVQQKVENRRVR